MARASNKMVWRGSCGRSNVAYKLIIAPTLRDLNKYMVIKWLANKIVQKQFLEILYIKVFLEILYIKVSYSMGNFWR